MRCARYVLSILFFFFNDTATTEIYTLSLHDALPISYGEAMYPGFVGVGEPMDCRDPVSGTPSERGDPNQPTSGLRDRKSTRLNSSHANISYAVFCLKKKTTQTAYSRTNCRTHRRRNG